jgi:L-alanine-DL-glutamate epimerase-like enolase superfamily enzyme
VLELHTKTERWPLKEPFRISGYVFTEAEIVCVTLTRKGRTGMGEAAGVYYHQEDPRSMRAQIDDVRSEIETVPSRQALRELLPPGGARNAVDCALWDLEAKEQAAPAWHIAGLSAPKPLATTQTIGADTPAEMARRAAGFVDSPRLKLKLTGEDDAPRLRAVREARLDAWIGVDGNQGFTRATLQKLYPVLVEANVQLIEQPLKIGAEAELDDFPSAIPIAADESLQGLTDIAGLKGRFQVGNIKLDKCGGLTEALLMAKELRRIGIVPMVGCMEGTSLSIAPALVVGQLCDLVDLDGPVFLAGDREPHVTYRRGMVSYGDSGWGNPEAAMRAKAS